eukprot:CAMPEP_0117436690 /NCGR_PEP_ID=MMETSP0759-20121206/1136_1 /TAXON_ID=63605 /ORGANISM="Percolomonas cosmopolitus, Strain WS" /LENGTH=634 /DNA_ID=CAMNT_0005228295 /DNA_START=364 /DNA_END=2268 /DNA_ORIENTATION=+
MYRLMEKNGEITQEKKDYVSRTLSDIKDTNQNASSSKNSPKRPSSQQYAQMARDTQLSRYQIYALVERQMDPKGRLTDEVRHEIATWVGQQCANKVKHDFHPDLPNVLNSPPAHHQNSPLSSLSIPHDAILMLSKKTHLSRRQVYSMLRREMDRLIDPPRKITPEKRRAVLAMSQLSRMSEHSSSSISENPILDIPQIHQKVDLSMKQIRNIIRVAQRQSSLNGKISQLRKHLREVSLLQVNSQFDLPALESEMAQKYSIPQSIVKRILERLRAVPITDSHRDTVQQWLLKHRWRKPTRQEAKQLACECGLLRNQLRGIVTRLRKKYKSRITQQQWERIRDWTHTLNESERDILVHWRPPQNDTKTLLDALSQLSPNLAGTVHQFSLSLLSPPHLILNTIQNLDNPPGIVTEENRQFVTNYISQHGERNVRQDLNQLQHLVHHTNLDEGQVQELIHHCTVEAPGQITPLKRMLIADYFNQHPHCIEELRDDSGLHIKTLRERTSLNSAQIRGILHRLAENTQQEITAETKNQVRDFVRSSPAQSMTQKQMIEHIQIQLQCGLTKTQLKNLIREVKDVSEGEKMTPEKKELLQEWLSENNFRKPTASELSKLQIELSLSKRQLMNAVYYERRKRM